ncbi:MAG: GNAT family N-acetyltransferase [Flavobacteriales bacterium]|nr:GNAT family N-acetyltransferase [Flavobacteriales bacterium]MBP9080857.1 GNAT family N-acetyltransferase [Flavobacteriales bacterium]
MDGYDLKPVEAGPEDLKPVIALLRSAFPNAHHFTESVLRWQYVENPAGLVVGANAWHGKALAGHYAALPMWAIVDGKRERGLLSLNTATHVAHQGKGLFTRLALATYERATREGYGFVVGVANAQSTPGFLKRLDFGLVAPLRAMIGVGPLPVRESQVPVQFEQAWEPASIAWRLRHPFFGYSVLPAGNDALILCNRRQFGARYILGIRPGTDIPGECPKERHGAWGKVWLGLDPAMRWSGRAYVNIPVRFRPAPLNFIFKDLSGAGRTLDPAQVRFEAMDFDVL